MNQVTRVTDYPLRSATGCRLAASVTVGFLQDCRRMFVPLSPELPWSGRGPSTAERQLGDSQATKAQKTATFGGSRRQLLEPERGSESGLCRVRDGGPFRGNHSKGEARSRLMAMAGFAQACTTHVRRLMGTGEKARKPRQKTTIDDKMIKTAIQSPFLAWGLNIARWFECSVH